MLLVGDEIINLKNKKEAIIIPSAGIDFSNKFRIEKKLPPVYCIQYEDNSVDYVFENFIESIKSKNKIKLNFIDENLTYLREEKTQFNSFKKQRTAEC